MPTPNSSQPALRLMHAADTAAVAALHAASWRSAYRGILSDEYLAADVDRDRLETWTERLSTLDPMRFGIVASDDAGLAGFVYLVGAAHPHFGTLIDNLHVAPARRSSGLGPQLLRAAAAEIVARRWPPALHLWVYDANRRARAFYARMGGREVEQVIKRAPDGRDALEWRVVWDDARVLLEPG
ncbi:MAG TPA: GNAT family N-acetyltransferase [Gemmatimonadaceae bacterium]|nr:GNAT family N-acetyltransferase [Gemmatimonadaceae bacterium]